MNSDEIAKLIQQRDIEKDRLKKYGDDRSGLDKMKSAYQGLSGLDSIPPEALEKLLSIIAERNAAADETNEVFDEEEARRKRNRMFNPANIE